MLSNLFIEWYFKGVWTAQHGQQLSANEEEVKLRMTENENENYQDRTS